MANVAVIGSQWGDEGKGKIVDWLSNRSDVVVRFQGGHNAGHTLVIDGVVVNPAFSKAAKNIKGLDILPSVGANVYDILKRDTLVLTKQGLAAMEDRLK